jgi:tetratricopeptide (TPR) repeat protein
MATEQAQPIEIFYSYAHEDENLRKELNNHLYNLQRANLITGWHDRNISAGTEWKHEIDIHLDSAQIILLLISPDFIASDYCYGIEVKRAMERHEAGEARVIPIILKRVDWEDTPFHKLQALPKNAKPVTSYRTRSDAFFEIAKSIKEILKELKPTTSHNVSSPTTSKPETLPPLNIDLLRSISTNEEQPDPGPVFYVPHRRNNFFTAREKILDDLHDAFTKDGASDATTIRVLSGLGGMGKTQIAIEYAYRHQEHYRTVLWTRADTPETLFADFVNFADLLKLPGSKEQDQKYTINAVKYWLDKHTNWLLILDNVEDLRVVYEYFPPNSHGHILLTTRTQVAGGIATRQEIEKMEPEEGALLLLKRASIISNGSLDSASQEDRTHAITISTLVDGLPLALDQAAAYIEETGVNLPGYIDLYSKRQAKLLSLRGGLAPGHPEPVSTTWSLSFEKVEQANLAAADLLRFFAFLHPDAIPDDLISKGVMHLGPSLQSVANDLIELNQAIGELRKYSLIRRNPEGTTFSLHRLVQTVLKDAMDEQTQRDWAERTVRAVNEALPKAEFKAWTECQRYLPHAQQCLVLIEQWNMTFPEVGRLLNEVGYFLVENGQYTEATYFLEQALALREQIRGPEDLEVAESLNNLAELYRLQGKYSEIEPLYQRALSIREQVLGPMHPDVAKSLNNLARPYHHLQQFDKAIPLYKRALSIREQKLGPMHPDLADTLNDLGVLYDEQGQYIQAKTLIERALSIREQVLGPTHPDIANSLNSLSSFYRVQGQYIQAKTLIERALSIQEQVLAPAHPDTANSLNNLGSLYQEQGQHVQAKTLIERALSIREQVLGPTHPNTANSLNNLGYLYLAQRQYVQAKTLIERALSIQEQVLGPIHTDTAHSLGNLGNLYLYQRNYTRAEPLFQRALSVYEQVLGPEHPDTVRVLKNYAQLLRAANRKTKAAEMEERLKAAQRKRAQEEQDYDENGE